MLSVCFKVSFDLLVIALLNFIMLLSTHSEVEARPTGCITHSFNNLKGTSISRTTNQSVPNAREASLKPSTAVSTMELQVTRYKTERIADNQREMVTADASGVATTPFPVNENTCIKRYRYRIICNYFFAIPVCKKHQGCYEVKKIVSFGKGRTYAITFKCQRFKQLPSSWEKKVRAEVTSVLAHYAKTLHAVFICGKSLCH